MRHLDLFSGIGGFALAAEAVWPDVEHVFCDSDPFCQNILRKHWPDATIYGDIRELTADRLVADAIGSRTGMEESSASGPKRKAAFASAPTLVRQRNGSRDAKGSPASHRTSIDLLTGGFPCQPFSNAGKKRGDKDDRFLWPEMLRVIRETKPAVVIGENVAGIVRMALDQVCADLEGEGYAVQPFIVPACAVGAPHRRDRVWIVARHSEQQGLEGLAWNGNDKTGRTQQNRSTSSSDIEYASDSRRERRGTRSSEDLRSEIKDAERQDNSFSRSEWNRDWREVAIATCHDRVDDGLSERMVVLPDGSQISQARWRREALKAYGNSIVPQVAVEIMRAIKESYAL